MPFDFFFPVLYIHWWPFNLGRRSTSPLFLSLDLTRTTTPHTTSNQHNSDVLRNECFKRETAVGEALQGLYRDEGLAFLHRYVSFFVVSY